MHSGSFRTVSMSLQTLYKRINLKVIEIPQQKRKLHGTGDKQVKDLTVLKGTALKFEDVGIQYFIQYDNLYGLKNCLQAAL